MLERSRRQANVSTKCSVGSRPRLDIYAPSRTVTDSENGRADPRWGERTPRGRRQGGTAAAEPRHRLLPPYRRRGTPFGRAQGNNPSTNR